MYPDTANSNSPLSSLNDFIFYFLLRSIHSWGISSYFPQMAGFLETAIRISPHIGISECLLKIPIFPPHTCCFLPSVGRKLDQPWPLVCSEHSHGVFCSLAFMSSKGPPFWASLMKGTFFSDQIQFPTTSFSRNERGTFISHLHYFSRFLILLIYFVLVSKLTWCFFNHLLHNIFQ